MADQLCIFCNENIATTRDHTPPKNLFPKDKREDLITVPCCRECNQSFSDDEEYLMTIISSTGESQRNPSAQVILKKVFRSLNRIQAKGFKKYLSDSINPVKLFTRTGIYLGHASKIKTDMNRVYNVIEKTVKGLVYHETEQIIDENFNLRIEYIERVSQVEKVLNIFKNCPIKRVFSDNIFSYRAGIIEDGTPVSSWLLTIYDSHVFLVNVKRIDT